MALPFIIPAVGWVAIVLISGAGVAALYQIRLTVENVSEVFTSPESSLNNIVFQALIGAGAVYVFTKYMKGR